MNKNNRKNKPLFCSNNSKPKKEHSLSDQNLNVFQCDFIENVETKLIRTLIAIVYEHELEIIQHIQTFYSENEIKKKFSFIIDESGFERFRRYQGEITQSNLRHLLKIREATFTSWLHARWSIKSLHNRTFVNIIGSVKNFPEKSPRIKFWNAIMDYAENCKQEFTTELLLIFNENSKKFFNYEKISKLLNFHNAFLVQNFHYDKSFETFNKYFNLLIAIFLLRAKEISLDSSQLKCFKQKCYKLVFNTLVNQGKIKNYRKSEFEILFYSLLYININRQKKDEKSYERFELVDLSAKLSDEGYRYIFSETFTNDYSIKRISLKLRDLLEEMCIFVTPEAVIEKIDQYLKNWDREYHEHWQLLYPIHVESLLLLTLGFNIKSFQFFKDAELELWQLKEENKSMFIYRIDIDRHHLDLDAEYYLPFDFSENKGYIPKLAPLFHSDHTIITNQIKSGRWDRVKYLTQLYKCRLVHIFELLLTHNKHKNIAKQLRNKTDKINNRIVYIWKGLSNEVILELNRRFQDRQNLSKDEFLMKYYKNFYTHKYKPHLKKTEADCPNFWFWYKNNYLRERESLFNKLNRFYNKRFFN